MSKFNEALERQIKARAEKKMDIFWNRFEQLLNEHDLPRNVMFDGLRDSFKKSDDNGNEWRHRLLDVFIGKETNEFLTQLVKFENYFKDPEDYRF